MEIRSLQPLSLPGTPAAPARVAAWQVGQILQATVTLVDKGVAQLRIGSEVYQGRIDAPLTAGETLSLRVVSNAAPAHLQILARPGTPDSPESAALRQRLPLQQSLAAPLAQALASRAEPARLPAATTPWLQRIEAALPGWQAVTQPVTLRAALGNSGLFFESRLAQAAASGQPPAVVHDLKALLLGLRQALGANSAAPSAASTTPPPAPPAAGPAPQAALPLQALLQASTADRAAALAAATDGALARLELHQLASGERAGVWTLELPVRREQGIDIVGLRIEREQREGHGTGGEAPGEDAWSVSLALDLPGLGPLRCLVSLRQTAVSVGFWAEDAHVAARLESAMDTLRSDLTEAGLEVGHLTARQGQPPPPAEPPPGRLLSVRA